MKRVPSLLAMVSTLIVSFLPDWGYSLLNRTRWEQFRSEFSVSEVLRPMFIGEIIANLIFVLMLLGLAWLVLLRYEKDVLTVWIFVGLGLICMLYLPMVLIGPKGLQEGLTSSGFRTATRGFRNILMEKGFATYFELGSSGIFVIGILGLSRKQKLSGDAAG
jgi:hypothetical protein